MLTIGLTGGIGCGKSSAASVFSELGVEVIDTDQIAHQLTRSGGAAVPAIRNLFGDHFVTQDGALDRKKMRQQIFSDEANRTKLEALLHPLILTEVTRLIQQSQSPYVMIAIPLLFETKDFDHLIQRILVIDCEEQLQISRTMARSQLSVEEVKAIMAAQVSRQHRLDRTDDIVENSGNMNDLKKQIIRLHRRYLALTVGSHV